MSDCEKLGSQSGSHKLSNIYILLVELIWEWTVVPLQREWSLHGCHSRSVYILVAIMSKENSIFDLNWYVVSILAITHWIMQLVLLPCNNNSLCHYAAMAPQSTSKWLQMRTHIYYLISRLQLKLQFCMVTHKYIQMGPIKPLLDRALRHSCMGGFGILIGMGSVKLLHNFLWDSAESTLLHSRMTLLELMHPAQLALKRPWRLGQWQSWATLLSAVGS